VRGLALRRRHLFDRESDARMHFGRHESEPLALGGIVECVGCDLLLFGGQ
jgi:hypothetical protein